MVQLLRTRDSQYGGGEPAFAGKPVIGKEERRPEAEVVHSQPSTSSGPVGTAVASLASVVSSADAAGPSGASGLPGASGPPGDSDPYGYRAGLEGLLEIDCDRLIRNDRVMFGSCMVASGDADAMVTGNTRRYSASLDKIKRVIPPRPGEIMFALSMIVNKGKTIFMADTHVHEYPNAQQLSDIAISCARVVRLFGFDPKIAFLSHSTFGIPMTQRTKHIRDAVEILKNKSVDFKFDGEMQPDVALDEEYKELYPFSKIVGNANVLIMPGQHSAAVSLKMMKTLGGAKIIGPFLVGLGQPIEIAPLRSSTGDILNLASVAAYSAEVIDYNKN